jgi:hypothetical protein
MKVKQISVFIQNKKGRLCDVLNVLAKANISLRALCIADTTEFGILRMIVPDPDAAKKVLEKNNFTVKENDVIAIGVPDKPGGLAEILNLLDKADMNVEYAYAFAEKTENKAIVVLRIEKPEPAIKILRAGGVHVLESKEVYSL